MATHENYSRKVRFGEEESLSKIVGKIAPGSIVFDVGCGSGMLGEYLVEHKQCIVDGVDSDASALALAKSRYRTVLEVDLETAEFANEFEPSAYDIVVVADVLEHIVRPGILLSQLKRLVKPSGLILFSVPNITHIAVGLDLLLGKFTYRENGILDDTHVRFFSRDGLIISLEEAGIFTWEIDTVQKSISETEFDGHTALPLPLLKQLANERVDAQTYQWIISAKTFASNHPIHDRRDSIRSVMRLLPSATLFWTSSFHDEYSENNCFYAEYLEERGDSRLIIFTFGPGNCEYPVTNLRIDIVNDIIGFFFYESRLIGADGDELWAANEMLASETVSAGTYASRTHDGTFVLPENIDPQWYPSIPKHILAKIVPGSTLNVRVKLGISIITRLASEVLAEQQRQLKESRTLAEILNGDVVQAKCTFQVKFNELESALEASKMLSTAQVLEIADRQTDLLTHEQSRLELTHELNYAQSELRRIEIDLSSALGTSNQLQAELVQASELIHKLKSVANLVKARADQAASDAEEAHSQLHQANANNSSLSNQIVGLRGELDRIKVDASERVIGLRNELNEANTFTAKLHSEIGALTAQIRLSNEEQALIESTLLKLTITIDELEELTDAANARIAHLEPLHDQVCDELALEKQNALRFRAEIEALTQASQTDRLSIDALQTAASRDQEASFSINAELQSTRDALSFSEAVLTDVRNQLSRAVASVAEADTHRVEQDRQHAGHVQDMIQHTNRLTNDIHTIQASTSWKLTAPLRFLGSLPRKIRTVSRAVAVLPSTIRRHGGPLKLLSSALRRFRNGGLAGLRDAVFSTINGPAKPRQKVIALPKATPSLIPHFIDPRIDALTPTVVEPVKLIIHLYLNDASHWSYCLEALRSVKQKFQLVVTIPTSIQSEVSDLTIREGLPRFISLSIVRPRTYSGPLASLIPVLKQEIQFRDYFCHWESSSSNSFSNDFRENAYQRLKLIFGSNETASARFEYIKTLLARDNTIVFAQGVKQRLSDAIHLADVGRNLSHIFESDAIFSNRSLEDIDSFVSPFFISRRIALSSMIKVSDLVLSKSIFSPYQIEKILGGYVLQLQIQQHRRNIEICETDSVTDFLTYENQLDFSADAKDSTVKILSFYLPQFHPTPENDEWHGKDFTEWTNVKGANPLFVDHYQQHIAHSDLGYYSLKSVDTLHQQTDLMRKSGVFGQVFYHYWFGGRLILEAPAKLLLDNTNVEMPFCFCWANENWTRRWDGDDADVLLGQKYSDEDARGFIHYLIPFFKDSRYITVDSRPVLYVYRPSSIPSAKRYVQIWQEECLLAGLPTPYLVSVLTRGALSPREFGMDGGVERVLHDWTDGAVPDIKNELQFFDKFNGHVLDYQAVAAFYSSQSELKDFDYYRSVVPIWDNTARYGDKAYIVHGSTPDRFQAWLENCVAYAKRSLPIDRQFVVVNAWNEWAEGAHLEPDTRYGYAYLNAVGRALCKAQIDKASNVESVQSIVNRPNIHIEVVSSVVNRLTLSKVLNERFTKGLKNAVQFLKAQGYEAITVSDQALAQQLGLSLQLSVDPACAVCLIRQPVFMQPHTLLELTKSVVDTGITAVANAYGVPQLISDVGDEHAINADHAFTSPLVMRAPNVISSGHRGARLCTSALCFLFAENDPEDCDTLPDVSTILRIHPGANFDELRSALCSIYAMHDMTVQPVIAAQDLSFAQESQVKDLLKEFTWSSSHPPIIKTFQSATGKGDLRSEMLNVSLQNVATTFACILDFDDLLMPHAYRYLASRLEKTGKAVSFGRVYSTSRHAASSQLFNRTRAFEYGYSYSDFVAHNHAPIHSIMIDVRKIDWSKVRYFNDQKFMEDYFLTLQIFTAENGTWADLNHNIYIGDYIHNVDREHTLALNTDEDRQKLISTPEYQICEQRIRSAREAALL